MIYNIAFIIEAIYNEIYINKILLLLIFKRLYIIY